MRQTLIDAIRRRSVLHFTYEGHTRTVEPHAVGNGTSGHEVLHCFQTAGGSIEGKVPDWKLMLLSEIRELTVGPETFQSERPGYHRGDKVMSVVYAEL